jgi:predicted Fe-Mo cluster-binding NifX family protein
MQGGGIRMKVCFPVQSNEGLESRVFNHFGSAPAFVIVDITTNALTAIINKDQHHAQGGCNPIKAIDGHKINAIVVGGIGGGALGKLNQAGIRVYQAGAASIQENIALFSAQQLPEYTINQCCGGHSKGGGCAH